jgi:hypothetical protein
MTTTTIRKPASRRLREAQSIRPEAVRATRPRSRTVKITKGIQLINEVLSRARMRRPQDTNSEAFRSARQIMISSRREQSRMLGL